MKLLKVARKRSALPTYHQLDDHTHIKDTSRGSVVRGTVMD